MVTDAFASTATVRHQPSLRPGRAQRTQGGPGLGLVRPRQRRGRRRRRQPGHRLAAGHRRARQRVRHGPPPWADVHRLQPVHLAGLRPGAGLGRLHGARPPHRPRALQLQPGRRPGRHQLLAGGRPSRRRCHGLRALRVAARRRRRQPERGPACGAPRSTDRLRRPERRGVRRAPGRRKPGPAGARGWRAPGAAGGPFAPAAAAVDPPADPASPRGRGRLAAVAAAVVEAAACRRCRRSRCRPCPSSGVAMAAVVVEAACRSVPPARLSCRFPSTACSLASEG